MINLDRVSSHNTLVICDEKAQRVSTANFQPEDEYIESKAQADAFSSITRDAPLIPLEVVYLNNRTLRGYLSLAKNFHCNYQTLNFPSFSEMESFLITPCQDMSSFSKINAYPYKKEQCEHEKWLENTTLSFFSKESQEGKNSRERQGLKAEEGSLFSDALSFANYSLKKGGVFARDNLTIRGNISQATNELNQTSLFELLPAYGTRKASIFGLRLLEAGANIFLGVLGTLLAPVTLGISKIITNQSRVIITLSGECFEKRLEGASENKIENHAKLRGLSLEIPNALPVVGDAIQIGEGLVQLGAATTLLSTKIADLIFGALFKKYQDKIPQEDLGDPRVLLELDKRIDYLSRFLLPHGEYWLVTEKDKDRKEQMKKVLDFQLEFLRTLERRKTKALQFYKLALIANRVPNSHKELIHHCIALSDESKINGHKIARRCLAQLMKEISGKPKAGEKKTLLE